MLAGRRSGRHHRDGAGGPCRVRCRPGRQPEQSRTAEPFAPDDLAEIAGTLARRGGRLIVDEAFMDVLGRQSSLVPRLPAAGAIVLRSFGKAYGLAGLRLGFAAASPDDCALLREAIGPWAVSGPAIEIGRRALTDDAWLAATVGRLRDEAERLDRLLQSAGFDIVGGTPLFRLAQHETRRDGSSSSAGPVF